MSRIEIVNRVRRGDALLTRSGSAFFLCVLCDRTFHWGGPATNHANAHVKRSEAYRDFHYTDEDVFRVGDCQDTPEREK